MTAAGPRADGRADAGRSRWLVPLALAACVVLGAALRMLPAWQDPGIALRDDAAFHVRIVSATVARGAVPEVDPLSGAPEGRRLAQHLPLGFYRVAATFHAIAAPFGASDPRWSTMLFVALCGGAIAAPVFFATRALGAGAGAALLAAFVAATLPAHLHRTFGHWVRYDALGTLLITAHLAFAFRALRDGPVRVRRLDALASAALLAVAASTWRVSLVLAPIEAAWLIAAILARGVDVPTREWAIAVALVGSAAFAAIEPMRSQGIVQSPAWIAFLIAAVASFVRSSAPRARFGTRAFIAARALGVALLLSSTFGRETYGETFNLFALKLRQIWDGAAASTPVGRLQLDVVELYGLTPLALLIGPQQYLALGPWALAAPLVIAWRRARDASGSVLAELREVRWFAGPVGLFVVVSVAFAVLALLFSRNKGLLAPCVAIACGLVAAALWSRAPSEPAATRQSRTPKPAAARRSPSPHASRALTLARLAFAASVLATAATGYALATSRHVFFDPRFLEMTEWLKTRTAPGAIVAAPWWQGYEIQALAERPTVTDGLLEDERNRARTVELFQAMLAREPEPLTRFSREHRVSYLVIPSPGDLEHIAWVAEPALAEHLRDGRDPTSDEANAAIVRLMRGRSVPGFTVVFANDLHAIARFEDNLAP